jgi:hypothetical protein
MSGVPGELLETMQLRSLALVVLAACSTSSASPPAIEFAPIVAEGPAAHRVLLARWDAMQPGAERDALAGEIDRVAHQKYATYSRMYWHTDLEAAKRVARAERKPILSLRMLGRLDEDLSCANSRYFRVALYANRELSKFLRESFVLHWSSERPVPKVTIDYGDGRTIHRTLKGNSAHYVLDANGRPIDVLPGLYAPSVFHDELMSALRLFSELGGADKIAAHHEAYVAQNAERWKTLPKVLVAATRWVPETVRADRNLYPKYLGEAPVYEVLDLGVSLDPTNNLEAWVQVGLRFLPTGSDRFRLRIYAEDEAKARDAGALLPVGFPVGTILDDNSRALIAKLAPRDWRTGAPADANALDSITHDFERAIVAETASNEVRLRPKLRRYFADQQPATFEALNRFVYDHVFATPADDAWLGLAPQSFLALANDGR